MLQAYHRVLIRLLTLNAIMSPLLPPESTPLTIQSRPNRYHGQGVGRNTTIVPSEQRSGRDIKISLRSSYPNLPDSGIRMEIDPPPIIQPKHNL